MESFENIACALDAFAADNAALARLITATAQKADFSEVAQNMVDAVAELADADVATLFILDDQTDRFDRYFQRRYSDQQISWSYTDGADLTVETGRTARLLRTREPNIIDTDQPNVQDVEFPDEVRKAYKSMVSVPLVGSVDVRGVLSLVWRAKVDWTSDRVESLMRVGNIVGMTVEREQRKVKAIELAIVEERRRLSAELHDNLAQLVTAIKFQAEMAQFASESSDASALEQHLDRIVAISAETLTSLREEMLSLRIGGSGSENIQDSLAQMVNRMASTWGVRISLDCNGLGSLQLARETELHLTRIVHEALSNALRHSGAEEVSVVLSWDNDWLELAVADFGCGFDVASVPPERLGLRVMNERARSIGGEVSVESSPGVGTTVRLLVRRSARMARMGAC